jgi:hypothetical protein
MARDPENVLARDRSEMGKIVFILRTGKGLFRADGLPNAGGSVPGR